jgi:hypothetical protein
MAIDLPTTEHNTARELAAWFSAEQLGRAIAYLELVHDKKINPGPEIERLLGENTLLTWTIWEADAVQRRLALALCIKKNVKNYPITKTIQENVNRNRDEVLRSYNTR